MSNPGPTTVGNPMTSTLRDDHVVGVEMSDAHKKKKKEVSVSRVNRAYSERTFEKIASFDERFKSKIHEEEFLTELYSHEEETHFVGFSPKLFPEAVNKALAFKASKGRTSNVGKLEKSEKELMKKKEYIADVEKTVFCTGGEDGQIVLYSTDDNGCLDKMLDVFKREKVVHTKKAEEGKTETMKEKISIASMCFTFNGYLCLGGKDGALSIFDYKSADRYVHKSECRVLATQKKHKDTITSIACNPNPKYAGEIITCSDDGGRDNGIKLWKTEDETVSPPRRNCFILQLGGISGHVDRVVCLAFKEVGRGALTLFSGSWDKTIKEWHIPKSKLKWVSESQSQSEIKAWRTFTGHRGGVNSISLAPPPQPPNNQQQLLCSGSKDNTIKLWCLQTGATLRTISDHTKSVRSVCFSKSCHEIISGGSTGEEEHTVLLHRLSASKKAEEIKHERSGDGEGVRCLRIAGEGHTMISGSTDPDEPQISIWEKPEGKKNWKYSKSLKHKINGISKKMQKLQAVAISNDGKMFVTGHNANQLIVWLKPNTEKGWKDKSTPISQDEGFRGDKKKEDGNLTFFAVAISEDKSQFAVGTQSDIYLCKTKFTTFGLSQTLKEGEENEEKDSKGGEEIEEEHQILKGHEERVTAISYTSNVNELISSSHDYNVILWNIQEQKKIRTFKHPESVLGINFLPKPNNDLILTTCDDHIARVWDTHAEVQQPTALKQYPGRHGGMVSSENIVVSRDDIEVVTWFLGFKKDGQSGSISLGDANDAAKNDGTVFFKYSPTAFPALVRVAAFAPDGKTIISATEHEKSIYVKHIGLLNHHLPSAVHEMLEEDKIDSFDRPLDFSWAQSGIGRLLDRHPESLIEPILNEKKRLMKGDQVKAKLKGKGKGFYKGEIGEANGDNTYRVNFENAKVKSNNVELENIEVCGGDNGQNLCHYAAAKDIPEFLNHFLNFEKGADEKLTERLQRIAMAAVLMKDTSGRCPLRCALDANNGRSVNAILKCYTKILSPEFAIFAESSRAQEVHLSELVDIKLLIDCLDEFPRITLNFMGTLTLLPCYDDVSKGCDRLEGIETQIGKGSKERSPPYFWQELFFEDEAKQREEKEYEARKIRIKTRDRLKSFKRGSSEENLSERKRALGPSKQLSRKFAPSKRDLGSNTNTDNPSNNTPDGEEDTSVTDTDQQSNRKGAPVIAKLNPLKNCAAKPNVKESSFLQALIIASEKTNDYRVWENEVIISIVQFKWDALAKNQYTVHFVLAIVMVVTFAIDASFIAEARNLPGYSGEMSLSYCGYRAPLTICFFIWLYFFQHEFYQHWKSLMKFREDLKKKEKRGEGVCMSLRRYITFRYYAEHFVWFFRELFGSIWEFLDTVSLIFLALNFISMLFFTVLESEDDMSRAINSNSYWFRFAASIVTLPILALNTLYYLQGFEASGQLVRMIIGIVKGVRVYVGIMLIIMSGFSMAFYMFFKLDDDGRNEDLDDCTYEKKSFRNPAETLLMSYGVMLGEVGKPQKDYTANSNWLIAMVGVILFVVFTFIINIVMLNLLIAIMGDIFDKIQENAKAEFMFAKAGIICEFEATPGFFKWVKVKYFFKVKKEEMYPTWVQVLQPATLEIEEADHRRGQLEWGGKIKAIKSGQDKICTDLETMKKDIQIEVMKTSINKTSLLENESKVINEIKEQQNILQEKQEAFQQEMLVWMKKISEATAEATPKRASTTTKRETVGGGG
ncbi:hypothetical protein TrLO_g1517 [Triparma laevis f. longispina]|uniref:Ion transport domain-containing protein n=1 Tax=Triparma laevis f. longispina TaxID=1714387 RepID=A0A9W7ATT2_9STRA|nr:hypothetical protein TrLO_g1517 [Triparma laevis f. longispina]